MVEAMRRHLGLGLVAMLLSCAAFGTSGPVRQGADDGRLEPRRGRAHPHLRRRRRPPARSPCGACAAGGAACRASCPLAAFYGTLAVAAAQLGYFQAVSRLTVGVALLIEYLGIILVVLWVWALTRRTPHRLTGVGIVLALVGLALVLDVTGQPSPDLLGVLWGLLAAVGLAGHYVLAGPADRAARRRVRRAGPHRRRRRPRGRRGRRACCRWRSAPPTVGRRGAEHPRVARRRRARRSSPRPSPTSSASSAPATSARPWRRSSGLTEVLFAVLFAWLLLGELPGPVQLVGGLVLLSGVVAVRLGERDDGPHDGARARPISTFPRPSPRLGGLPRRGTSHRPELSGQTATCGRRIRDRRWRHADPVDPRVVRAPVVRCHVPRRGPTAPSASTPQESTVSDNKLVAETRTQFGKGAARKIRRDHKIPAVMYGHGTEPVHITLPGHESMLALKTSNALLTIVLDGKEQLALAKDVQRDPIKPVIEHVDLVIVKQGREGRRRRQRPPRGRGRPRDRRHHRPHEPPARGRGHQHPREHHRLRRGPHGRHAGARRPGRAARRRHAGHRHRGARRQRHRSRSPRRPSRPSSPRPRPRPASSARSTRRRPPRREAAAEGEAAAAEGEQPADEA